ncbi:DUF424 family protein [archaeon]|jgi:uncharacterized protein|nr:DUF424 family protein [archaeon]MBT6824053.1 DUF424 family protein [archaeon]MBT7107102.1 DUF424 family protein [archaeon]MBT7297714.1 DUF424 family protein [archaeon]
MYVKIHPSGEKEVVAICDEVLIGKKLTQGELELNISESFYKGDKKSVEEVKEIMLASKNLNLVGEETIALAINLKILDKENIIEVCGVEHAQLFSN